MEYLIFFTLVASACWGPAFARRLLQAEAADTESIGTRQVSYFCSDFPKKSGPYFTCNKLEASELIGVRDRVRSIRYA